jgi:hypothetical protein
MGALRIRFGNWCAVARALKTDRTTIRRVILRMTPAMAAGLTDHIWEIGELLDEAAA